MQNVFGHIKAALDDGEFVPASAVLLDAQQLDELYVEFHRAEALSGFLEENCFYALVVYQSLYKALFANEWQLKHNRSAYQTLFDTVLAIAADEYGSSGVNM